jgi:hypothetical protein
MDLIARTLLLKLLQRSQRSSSPARVVTLPITRRYCPEYFNTRRAEERDAIHASLINAQSVGLIRLEWGKHERSHELTRLVLLDPLGMAEYVGIRPAADLVEELKNAILPTLPNEHPWIGDLFVAACEKWARGQSVLGLALDEGKAIRQLFAALTAVARGQHEGLDLRTFSARYLGDSKAMERFRGRFAKIWREQFQLEDLDNDQIFEGLGLLKFPQPLLLRGQLEIQVHGQFIDVSVFQPYVGLPARSISAVLFPQAPPYVLTVENIASFFRYVNEIRDEGLILFTGGFPRPELRKVIGLLDQALPDSTAFYHWGDVDIGGLVIFRAIEQSLSRRALAPHLMVIRPMPDSEAVTLSAFDRRRLRRLVEARSAVVSLAQRFLDLGKLTRQEQEVIDPAAPSIACASRGGARLQSR